MSAFDSLDYRRFDHLGNDSDEDLAEGHLGNRQERPAPGSASQTLKGAEHRSGRIKIHPMDSTAPAWVYSDPETWVAPPDPRELELLHVGS